MATTSEEIQIRLGVDAKSLMSSLDRATGYVKQWKGKVKTAEEEYTSWWSNELKKREEKELDAAIRAATRSNRARALLRQRAAAREAKLAAEQARAEMLMQSEAAGAQSALVSKTLSTLGSKAIHLLKANLYLAAADLIYQLIPTAEEFWSKIYGVDPESTAKLQEQNDRLHQLRQNLKETMDAYKTSIRELQFGRQGETGKQEILYGEARDAAKEEAKAKKRLDYLREHKATVEEIAVANDNWIKSVTKATEALKALEEFTSGLSEEGLKKQFEARRKDVMLQARKDRTDLGTIEAFIQDDLARTGRTDPENIRKAEEMRRRLAGATVAGIAPSVGAVGDALKTVPFLGGVADAFKQAQEAVMRDTIQQVKIVEVEE